MRPFSLASVVIALLAPLTSSPAGCVQPPELSGTDTPYSLWGRCLSFARVERGARLPLDAIVYFPATGPGSLKLSVDRAALTQEFINDIFDAPKPSVIEDHQMTQQGVRLELSPTRLNITIYPSVVLRLRSDIPSNLRYRTFRGTPMFTVENVSGAAYAATDSKRVSEQFDDVFIQHVLRLTESTTKTLPDGSIQTLGSAAKDSLLPPWQKPSKVKD